VVVAFRFPASPEIGEDSEKGEKYKYIEKKSVKELGLLPR